ncbi:hypothetical protein [Oricola nitratireducens]|jgi:hypothetical protein|uniref:hypothetical protein n=1 Tax=Oricola nitratireducens TaxID=2775868 RepID=UPI003D16240F
MADNTQGKDGAPRYPTKNTIKVLNRTMPVPASRAGRIALGSALVAGGAVGFLPVVGFWMLPLGLLILANDVPRVRRWRRKLIVRWNRRGDKRDRQTGKNA